MSWEDVDKLGVRATSTSTAEGSIKGVDGGPIVTLAPKVCVKDADPVIEGNDASFTIQLDHVYLYDVTVKYTTVTGTAGGTDYTEMTSSVTIVAGQLSAIVKVATNDDDVRRIRRNIHAPSRQCNSRYSRRRHFGRTSVCQWHWHHPRQ